MASDLDESVKARLLAEARSAIRDALLGRGATPAEGDSSEQWPALERRGVFVTLRKAGRLRGCIGTFQPEDDMPILVRRMAVASSRDPRFLAAPLSVSELPEVRIEISVLSPLVRTSDPLALVPGVHGVYIRRGEAVGCFLPQVATDNEWDARTFLAACCKQKAGLGADAWNEPGTDVSLFTVEKFGD